MNKQGTNESIETIETILHMNIISDIGGDEGKNSSVKLAHDPQLNSKFAVKIIPKSKFIEDFGDDHENMFFYEAKVIYGNQHPNIVRIQHATSCENNVYYTMPYYNKGSLNKLIDYRFLTVREIVKISLEFLSGLHYIHTNKLVHFDIKPTNIMINDNGKAMLTDFGLTRYTNDYGVAKFSKLYTSHYPPECILEKETTNQSDIYQAGLTLLRMCNGNFNFKYQYNSWKEKGLEHLANAIKKGKFPERTYLPHIPSQLRKIITKALKTNPDDRYLTVLEMMNDISKVNKNLDIRFYIEEGNVYVWEKDNNSGSHYDKIKLVFAEDAITTAGKKVKVIDGKETNITCMNKSGYKDTKQAFKSVEIYIKD